MIFDNWSDLLRTVLIGTVSYASLVVLLRISGNRTLSKMNSFDLVITVAFGSILATILTSKDVSLAEGLVALALLIFLQFIVTWLSVRSRTLGKLVKTQPALLFRDGEFLQQAMKVVRVTEDEIRAAIRQHGGGDISQVAAVIMESDASLSVIKNDERGSGSALHGVADDKGS